MVKILIRLQICNLCVNILQLASWSYQGDELDVTNRSAKGDSLFFVDSGEWDLLGIPVQRNVVYFPGWPVPYPDVTFKLIFQVKQNNGRSIVLCSTYEMRILQ